MPSLLPSPFLRFYPVAVWDSFLGLTRLCQQQSSLAFPVDGIVFSGPPDARQSRQRYNQKEVVFLEDDIYRSSYFMQRAARRRNGKSSTRSLPRRKQLRLTFPAPTD